MAYINQYDEENQGQPVGGAPALMGQGGGGPALSVPPSTTPTSTGFVNIRDYLDKNQGGAQALGQNVGQTLSELQDTAESSVSSASEQAQQDISNATPEPLAPEAIDSAISDPQGEAGQAFIDYVGSTYEGPNSLVDTEMYQDALTGVNRAQEQTGLLGSEGGRRELSRGEANNPMYTSGQSALDAALLGLQDLSPVSARGDALDELLSGAVTTSESQAQAAREELQAGQAGARTSVLDRAGALQSEIDSAYESALAADEARINEAIRAKAINDARLAYDDRVREATRQLADQRAAIENSPYRYDVPTNQNEFEVIEQMVGGPFDPNAVEWEPLQTEGPLFTRDQYATPEQAQMDAAMEYLLGQEVDAVGNQAEAGQSNAIIQEWLDRYAYPGQEWRN